MHLNQYCAFKQDPVYPEELRCWGKDWIELEQLKDNTTRYHYLILPINLTSAELFFISSPHNPQCLVTQRIIIKMLKFEQQKGEWEN